MPIFMKFVICKKSVDEYVKTFQLSEKTEGENKVSFHN